MPAQLHLHNGGVSVVLVGGASGELAAIQYWGADLGDDIDLDAMTQALSAHIGQSSSDVVPRFSLIPQESEAYLGHPGLSGSRGVTGWSPQLRLTSMSETEPGVALIEAEDAVAALGVQSRLELTASGVLLLSHLVTNLGDDAYTLHELAAVLPVPAAAAEILDFAGRWSLERQPQRHTGTFGTYVRELRHGRTGFDAPIVMAAGSPGFGNRHGEIWAVHFGWSGNARVWFEHASQGPRSLAAAELFTAAGTELMPGNSYQTPILYGAYSAVGLDGISSRFHRYVRSRARHPVSARPVVFNTWEAVYFNQNLAQLSQLADLASSVGAERFVLDDGWFLGRRNDQAGLGDWQVDESIWPGGLGPLISHVRGTGMDFGLWVEPEMVNPDSDLYRAHPDWILQVAGHPPHTWRNQFALDVSRAEVYDYLLTSLDALLSDYDIAYLKWDHNRDIFDAAGPSGAASGPDTVRSVYRLLDELRRRHPDVEIESCSSGGARIDLGILERTDRVWGSDTNDALDRQSIQRWTSMVLPFELIGGHVGAPTAHVTGRTHRLALRAVTSMFGSFGIEWDISSASEAERGELAIYIALYKRFRGLLHSGTAVHADLDDDNSVLYGVVSADGREALYAYVQLRSGKSPVPETCRLPGLMQETHYSVSQVMLPADSHATELAGWLSEPLVLPGRFLQQAGLALPVMRAETPLLIHAVRA
jgi:alpha-galactosidase